MRVCSIVCCALQKFEAGSQLPQYSGLLAIVQRPAKGGIKSQPLWLHMVGQNAVVPGLLYYVLLLLCYGSGTFRRQKLIQWPLVHYSDPRMQIWEARMGEKRSVHCLSVFVCLSCHSLLSLSICSILVFLL